MNVWPTNISETSAPMVSIEGEEESIQTTTPRVGFQHYATSVRPLSVSKALIPKVSIQDRGYEAATEATTLTVAMGL